MSLSSRNSSEAYCNDLPSSLIPKLVSGETHSDIYRHLYILFLELQPIVCWRSRIWQRDTFCWQHHRRPSSPPSKPILCLHEALAQHNPRCRHGGSLPAETSWNITKHKMKMRAKNGNHMKQHETWKTNKDDSKVIKDSTMFLQISTASMTTTGSERTYSGARFSIFGSARTWDFDEAVRMTSEHIWTNTPNQHQVGLYINWRQNIYNIIKGSLEVLTSDYTESCR